MKSFSITLLLALLDQSQGFVSSSWAARRNNAPLIIAVRGQGGPLFISTTELTAEAQSTNEDNIVEQGQEESSSSSSSVEIPVVEGSSAQDEEAAASSSDEEETTKEEVVRHTLFVGNIPFGTCSEAMILVPSQAS